MPAAGQVKKCEFVLTRGWFFVLWLAFSRLQIFTPSPIHRGMGYCFRSISLYLSFCVCLYLCFFVSKIARKRLDRFAWNFRGRCGVTVGRPDSILGQFGETTRCRNANFFVSNITSKPLNRFAWNFQGRCGVTMGRPDYIFGQFRETARCATWGRGLLCFHTRACLLFLPAQ